MKAVRPIVGEIIAMFVDDGSLALLAVILIAVITAGVKLLSLPPLAGGVLLLAGCVAILIRSVRRAVQRR